jgi:hypothetical protein
MSDSIKQSNFRLEAFFAFAVSFLLLGLFNWHYGVWEPWESNIARILTHMWDQSTWMQVITQQQGQDRYIAELPFGYWLPALFFGIFNHELAMRLPAILLVAISAGLIFQIMHSQSNRTSAWLATFAFLLMPSVSFTSRFMISSGLGWLFCTLSILFFLRSLQSPSQNRTALVFGSLFALLSTLSLGLVGLIIPVIALLYLHAQEKIQLKALLIALASILLISALALWRLSIKQPDQVDWTALLWLQDSVHSTFLDKNRPPFHLFTHQIGFGLFPLSALLPVAFARLLSIEVEDHLKNFVQFVGIWFCLGFIMPAVLTGFSGVGMFLATPAVAMAVALYLDRAFRSETSDLVALWTTILFLALLDSNLKHDPRYYIETLVGQKIEDFPSELQNWRWARLLNFALLGTLIAYQSKFFHHIFAYLLKITKNPPKPHLHWLMFLISSVIAFVMIFPYLNQYVAKWTMIEKLVEAPILSALPLNIKIISIFIGFNLFFFWFQYSAWAYFYRSRHFMLEYDAIKHEEDALEKINPLTSQLWIDISLGVLCTVIFMYPFYAPGLPQLIFVASLMRAMEGIPIGIQFLLAHLLLILGTVFSIKMLQLVFKKTLFTLFFEKIEMGQSWLSNLQKPQTGLGLILVLLLSWQVFSQHVIAKTLTEHFSQKSLIDHYLSVAQADEKLYTYQLTDAKNSFYLRNQEHLSSQQFKDLLSKKERFFALIDRKQLSQIDKEFRGITHETLPVLNQKSYKMLLISNQLKAEEEDFNPIKKSLLKELPKNINVLSEAINFEDQIELVGWALDPFYPKSGSQLKISLFWRAKVDIRSNWKVFVHIDSLGQRIHGDHEMVEGLFPTSNWKKGDLIRDDHVMIVKRGISADRFKFYAGLYQGGTRMKIKNTNPNLKDQENRALIGQVSVK